MLPKLTVLQWIILFIFLFFYGFAVFAVTRDYYIRHPPRLSDAARVAHSSPAATASGSARRVMTLKPATQRPQRLASGCGRRLARRRVATDLGIDRSSTDLVALGDTADRLFAARRFEKAIPLYQRVLELEPADAETYNDLGLSLHYVGRADDALQVLQEGTELAPAFQRIWLSLGFVALQNEKPELARKALEQAEVLVPGTDIAAEATRLLGLIQSR